MKLLKLSFLALLVAPFLTNCADFNEHTVQPVDSGSADFSKYVAVGNSLAAGYQNGALYGEAQDYSYPRLLARQMQLSEDEFKYPRLSPGIGNRIEIASFNPPGSPSPINTVIVPLAGTNDVVNYIRMQPETGYQNLGIPGAILSDYLGTAVDPNFANRMNPANGNPFYAITLGPTATSIHSKVAAQNPSFVTFWLGNNDILGYVTSGGVLPANSVENFTALYNGSLAQLLAINNNLKVVAATIPGVTDIPYTTTVTATTKNILTASNAPGLAIMQGSGTATFIPTASLGTQALLLLTAQVILPYLQQPTGAPWRIVADGAGIPVSALLASYGGTIDTTEAFGSLKNPIPHNFVLDAAEIQFARDRVAAFNAAIKNAVQANSSRVALVDVNAIFAEITNNGGITVDGITLTPTPLSLFSLDGVHPTNRGHAVVANEFIKVINEKFGAKIPRINISSIPSGVPLNQAAN